MEQTCAHILASTRLYLDYFVVWYIEVICGVCDLFAERTSTRACDGGRDQEDQVKCLGLINELQSGD